MSAPETIQEATERRLRQVTEMVGEIRWLMERGEVPGQRELDFVRTADAALYDCAVLLRSGRAVSEGTPQSSDERPTRMPYPLKGGYRGGRLPAVLPPPPTTPGPVSEGTPKSEGNTK